MEATDRTDIKKRLGLVILKIIGENKQKAKENKLKGVKDHLLIDSLRKLAAASGVDEANIRRITKGTKNAGITTVVAVADGLDMSLSEFFRYYDDITKSETINKQAKKTSR